METPWQHTTVLLNEAVEALVHNRAPDAGRRHLRRCHIWARWPLATDPLAAVAAGPADRLRQGPRCRGSGRQRSPIPLLHPARRVPPSGRIASGKRAQACLMDLGVSSPQIDNPARGFSVSVSRARWTCAWTPRADKAWRNGWQQPKSRQIAEVIREYGEERFAGPIAKAIVARRQERGPISTTTELAELVAGAVKTREPGQNPATRTFQALRIFINAELEELQQALEASLACACNPEGGWS